MGSVFFPVKQNIASGDADLKSIGDAVHALNLNTFCF